MIGLVHYLIQHPTNTIGLAYPTEVGDDQYTGFGGFFLLGTPGTPTADAYKFYAIQEKQIVAISLERFRNSRSFFRAEVPQVGAFLFYAQTIVRQQPYIGSYGVAQGLVAIRRLRSSRPNELDDACRKYGFYFVGYSPSVEQ